MQIKYLISQILASLLITFSILTPTNKTFDGSTTNNAQIAQQKEDSNTFMMLLEKMKNTGLQKKEINPAIKCKNCNDQYMSLGTLEGCMMMWGIESIGKGHSEFETIKTILEAYIKLLFDDVSIEELKDFIFRTANDMKQACFNCKKIDWQKGE